MSPSTPPGDRPLRADARENIRLIRQAAREVFAERGYEVSIEEVARRSGVGMGTLYRHFPNKSALVERIAIDVMTESSAEIGRATAEEPDPWAAFTRVMRHMAQVRSSQMFPVSRRRTTEPGAELLAARAALLADLDRLVARTQDGGVLRGDVNVFDIVLILNSIPARAPDEGTDPPPADLAGRHLGVLLDGLRSPGTQTLPRPSATRRDLDQFFRTRFGL
ncbi:MULTISPECIES: TetR/AcrR family transcriptional regulator [unclassified Streptomyces]|uniref:TetR/AcrR family transcriptional regulator n=1 Tax=unclassified Streptomyces TaxID=2593676 RepID=UPI00081D8039|nr:MULTISPECIES: TetR/AcrR family transcriptional regulator [unclassified Streptomyces]MYR96383.1 TetR family transcriptional regulator [Streptomyces sp. SID4937]SCE08381.1 transcriptional regulator, TetR family [Streptomyces sp. ScaeMP-e83]